MKHGEVENEKEVNENRGKQLRASAARPDGKNSRLPASRICDTQMALGSPSESDLCLQRWLVMSFTHVLRASYPTRKRILIYTAYMFTRGMDISRCRVDATSFVETHV